MPRLVDLPNTKGDKEVRFTRSIAGALRALRSGHAVTTAGSRGAINLWRDDDGYYVCELMRNYQPVESRSFRGKKAAVHLFKDWLAEIDEPI